MRNLRMNESMDIVVVHGGTSSESDISSKNASYISKALIQNGHVVSLMEFDENIYVNLQKKRPQLVFVAVQGKYHGDGTLQAICEHLKLPYTGSKETAAAIINDKCVCKKICAYHGIKSPKFIYINKHIFQTTPKDVLLEQIEKTMSYPVVAKAISQGGSYGIEYISSKDDYEKIAKVFEFDDELIIEGFIKGRFVTTSVLEIEETPTALQTLSGENLEGEQNELVLFNQSFTISEADLSPALKEKIEKISIEVFRVLNAKNYARIDFMIEEETGIPYFIEINAVPGLKPQSFFPKAAEKQGISFNKLIEIIVENEGVGR